MATTAPRPTDPVDLRSAVKDSQYLLAYFSRTKIDIPEAKRKDFDKNIRIISSFGSDHAPSQSSDKIAEFWEAFISLSDKALPATIESIRYYFRYKDQRWFRPFAIVTMIALIMTIGLSLLSYVGSRAILAYDGDYAHWSQMQMLVRYLAEGGTVTLQQKKTANNNNEDKSVNNDDETAKVWQLSIKPGSNYASPPAHLKSVRTASPRPDETVANLDPKFDVPVAQLPLFGAILVDADKAQSEPVLFKNGFVCWPLFKMFAKAQANAQPNGPPSVQHVEILASAQPNAQSPARDGELPKPPKDPPNDYHVIPGGLTWSDCVELMNGVKPHVITIADDLALTYSSMVAERETLHVVLAIVSFPVTSFEALLVRPSAWVYHTLFVRAASSEPPNQDDEELKPLSSADAFNFFVLLQQRDSPIPAIFPIPSTKTFAGVFDARLAVTIANTYLLTFAFGLLGACVWVIRATNRRLENFTFAPSWIARYRTRILLGMVAGPTIGLFFDQSGHLLSTATTHTEVPSLSTQLSAGAIAFVAGFSIEILFALLDRLIRIIREFAGDNSPEYQTVK
jgi:hypothetical protein